MKASGYNKELILSRIKINENGCWIWRGAISGRYGGLRFNKKVHAAHRVSYEIFNEKHPGDLCVCHKCDVPLCVNPDHLFLGDQYDNMRDAAKKGRLSNRRNKSSMTHCKRGHEFTPENTKRWGARKLRICKKCDIIRYERRHGRKPFSGIS